MKSVTLTAFPRTAKGRGEVKKLRHAGRVPAVIYGRQNPPQALEINLNDIENLIKHSLTENLLVNLSLNGDKESKHLALVQEVQHDPLRGTVLHVDLHEVAEDEKVTIMVPVEPSGDAVGVKTGGGVLEHVLFKLKVRALPKDLPEVIQVDVSNLDVGQTIHLGDIDAGPGVEILGEKTISVLAVAAPITEAQEAAAEAGAASGTPGQVEMLKEKKEDTSGEKKGEKKK
jgi:large subunit ribosomal protein L25